MRACTTHARAQTQKHTRARPHALREGLHPQRPAQVGAGECDGAAAVERLGHVLLDATHELRLSVELLLQAGALEVLQRARVYVCVCACVCVCVCVCIRGGSRQVHARDARLHARTHASSPTHTLTPNARTQTHTHTHRHRRVRTHTHTRTHLQQSLRVQVHQHEAVAQLRVRDGAHHARVGLGGDHLAGEHLRERARGRVSGARSRVRRARMCARVRACARVHTRA